MTNDEELQYASIRERDVDLVVVVAAASVSSVWNLFHQSDKPPATQHSVPTPTGEIDILLRWPDIEVHIENKIDAEFQPQQPERYRQRSDDAKEDTRIILLAPRAYIDSHDDGAAEFDELISYEELETGLLADGSLLASELAQVVRHGIDQQRRGRTSVVSETRTSFFHAFAERSKSRGLPFVDTGNRGPKSSFFYAHNWDEVASRRVEIVAKFEDHRSVGIQVSQAESMLEDLSGHLSSDEALSVRATKTGTLIIEKQAPYLYPDSSAIDQEAEMGKFLDSAESLMSWWQSEGKPFLAVRFAEATSTSQ